MFYRCLGEGTSEDGNARSFHVNRFEKRESHQMIPVGMGEKHGVLISFFGQQPVAQSSEAGACINNDYIIAAGSYFQAGCVAAVPQILFTGNGYGTPRAPTANDHIFSPFSKLSLSAVRPFMKNLIVSTIGYLLEKL
jgi:hypothetical protein